MPTVSAEVVVHVDPDTAFAVSQTTGQVRLRWDPFIHRQRFLDGATEPARGVRTLTVHRSRLTMVSEYVSYAPPRNAGMRMVTGPWFFSKMAGGWRFEAAGEGRTRAIWKYNFACRPRFLAPIAERLGSWILGWEIRRRIAGFAQGCADPVVVAAAGAQQDK